MSLINFYNPVEIISGRDCVINYTGFSKFGKRCMIVCGRNSARLCGALDDLKNALNLSGVSYSVFDRVEENPSIETCHTAGAEARDFRADFVVGVGGGSPLDAAKAIAVYAANPDLEGEDIYNLKFTNPPLPICAVGTTAGTGSEVTQYSVLTVRSIGNKKTVASPLLFPKIAFADPNYTNTLPHHTTMATAVDALCHGIEGYFSKRANPITEALAEQAIKIMGSGLKELVSGALDCDLREKLLYGSIIAGQVISGTGTGFVHAMGYPLTHFDGLAYGVSNSYFIADFIEYMSLARPDKEQKIYSLMELSGIGEFRDLIDRAIPKDLILTREKVIRYTKLTAPAPALKNSVFDLSEDDMFDLYKQYSR